MPEFRLSLVGWITSRCSGKEPALLPRTRESGGIRAYGYRKGAFGYRNIFNSTRRDKTEKSTKKPCVDF